MILTHCHVYILYCCLLILVNEFKVILFYFPYCSPGEDISDDLVQNSVDPIGCPSNDSDASSTRPQFEYDAAFEAKVRLHWVTSIAGSDAMSCRQ